jgi:hypothetical protein
VGWGKNIVLTGMGGNNSKFIVLRGEAKGSSWRRGE